MSSLASGLPLAQPADSNSLFPYLSLAQPAVSDSLFPYLSIPSLLRLRETCRPLRACVDGADTFAELLVALETSYSPINKGSKVSFGSCERDSLGRLVIADGVGRLVCSSPKRDRAWTAAEKRILLVNLAKIPHSRMPEIVKIIEERSSTLQLFFQADGKMTFGIDHLHHLTLNKLAELVAMETAKDVESPCSQQDFAANDPRRQSSWPKLSTFEKCSQLATFSLASVKRLRDNFPLASFKAKGGAIFVAMPHIELDDIMMCLGAEIESLIAEQKNTVADDRHFDRLLDLRMLKPARFKVMLMLMEVQIAAADLHQEAGVTFYSKDDRNGRVAPLDVMSLQELFLDMIVKQIVDNGCPEKFKRLVIGSNHHLLSLVKTTTDPTLASLEKVCPALSEGLDLLAPFRRQLHVFLEQLRKLDAECPCGEEGTLSCGECSLLHCASCTSKCFLCAKMFCEDCNLVHVGWCERCGKTFCEDCMHVAWCTECGMFMCEDCGDMDWCDGCCKCFCEDCRLVGWCDECSKCMCEHCGHTDYCETCSKSFCEACCDISYCDDCAGFLMDGSSVQCGATQRHLHVYCCNRPAGKAALFLTGQVQGFGFSVKGERRAMGRVGFASDRQLVRATAVIVN